MNQPRIPIQAITFRDTSRDNSGDNHIIDHAHYVYSHITTIKPNETQNNDIKTIVTQSKLLSDHIYVAQRRINELLTQFIEQSK